MEAFYDGGKTPTLALVLVLVILHFTCVQGAVQVQ
jgi:hypothetical protein